MTDKDKSFWDIDEPRSPGEFEFLPSLPSPWQSGKDEETAGDKPPETLGKDKKKEFAILLEQLGHNSKQKRRSAARNLGILKNPAAVPALIDALRDASFFVQREAALALGGIGDIRAVKPLLKFLKQYDDKYFRDAILMITGKLKNQDSQSYCMDCFGCAREHSITLPEGYVISYYACRICHGNGFLKQGVENVTLSLDHSFSGPFTFENNHLTIEWFQFKRPLDCDEINIIDARDHEVEELVMKFRNDMDKNRGQALKHIPVLLSPRLSLSKAKQNLLRDTFLVKD